MKQPMEPVPLSHPIVETQHCVVSGMTKKHLMIIHTRLLHTNMILAVNRYFAAAILV